MLKVAKNNSLNNGFIFFYNRSWTDQMKEFEAAARKLAATHPLLLLRNLPLLAAGMKGRTDFDFSFFRSRNHMTFYSMALGNVPRAPQLGQIAKARQKWDF